MRITKEARCAKNAREYIGNRPRLVEGKIYTLIFPAAAGKKRKTHCHQETDALFKKRFHTTHFLKTLTGSKDRLLGGKWKNY